MITEPDGSFWCLADAKKLAELNRRGVTRYTYDNLTRWINQTNKSALQGLPGFISKSDSVLYTTDKLNVLQLMDNKNIDQLPSVNDQGQFVGMVDRSRIVSSLIIDVSNRLNKG